MADPITTSRVESGVTVALNPSSSIRAGDDGVFVALPTINGASVGLPPNSIYVQPGSGQLYRTI